VVFLDEEVVIMLKVFFGITEHLSMIFPEESVKKLGKLYFFRIEYNCFVFGKRREKYLPSFNK
jgi:hypothetical protein